MNDSINHALLITTLLERDIARICASGNEAQQGIAADCAEHRRQLANKLRHIANMEDIATVIESEQSFKAGDINDINDINDDTYLRHAAVSDAKALADYQRRLSRLGWAMAAIACVSAGVILAGIKIWFTYF